MTRLGDRTRDEGVAAVEMAIVLTLMMVLAFGAVFLPRSWMGAAHAWMGFAEMPEGPVFDSVMRQVSFSYGLHGVALWLIAADVVRYRPLVVLTAVGYLLAGPVFFAVDLGNGMPWSWMAGNGGSCLLIGSLLFGLLWGERVAATRDRREASSADEQHGLTQNRT